MTTRIPPSRRSSARLSGRISAIRDHGPGSIRSGGTGTAGDRMAEIGINMADIPLYEWWRCHPDRDGRCRANSSRPSGSGFSGFVHRDTGDWCDRSRSLPEADAPRQTGGQYCDDIDLMDAKAGFFAFALNDLNLHSARSIAIPVFAKYRRYSIFHQATGALRA